ncbi:hypothetical protein KL905_001645 [Ogataea polymorpha]|uniref:LST4 longin domain-containing protein n=1 Tax=Ogataea polymorpha TaxID=460523 RepID=A0A9P8T4E1_9ASCO|nr:hypothetical protein KL935_000434 [Ogataea polymorpha]KAG7905904.1 hypothetical protein KL906_004974 [Ogataea polymorpha]KAG7908203.1 hypothetical protein KL907_001693 [Ogataea polymorpha]KAG7921185.1 hypothetical protein KL927_000429 [Ogataea polymorpha]KAG7922424.1 hypothetical protein KL905_001645 [Ogataea polymorpha]
MLGNLLRKKEFCQQEPTLDPQVPPPPYAASDAHYNGSQLYGPGNTVPVATFRLSDKSSLCRLVVVQDSGIRSKQTLFDSALSLRPGVSEASSPAYLNKSFHHPTSELAALMFGYYGILLNETISTTKLHYLPPLAAMPASMLVTRLFSVNSSFRLCESGNGDPDWAPKPCVYSRSAPMCDEAPTRMAFGLIVPIGRDQNAHEILTNHWPEIAGHLESTQKLIVAKLRALASLGRPCEGSKPSFPAGCLQKEPDLVHSLHLFVRSLVFLIETPRLYVPLKQSDSTLCRWAVAVATWLELKDGRHPSLALLQAPIQESQSTSPSHPCSPVVGLKFLATLLTLILPHRREIVDGPLNYLTRRSVRVVLVTGNPVVSQKLVLILAGIFGYDHFTFFKSLEKDDDTDTDPGHSPTASKPIPIQRTAYHDDSSSESMSPEMTFSSGSTKGWEIPSKATPIISNSPKFTEFAKPERQPMSQVRRASSYASLQNLSTSYGSQSTTMSSSWRNRLHFGSFMERWRSGLGESVEVTPPAVAEYDEYPWKSVSSGAGNLSRLTRDLGSLDIDKEKAVVRTTYEIPSVGERVDLAQLVMAADVHFEAVDLEGGAKVLDIAPLALKIPRPQVLPLMTGFIDQYRPEFSLQACPVHYNLEGQIGESMRDDCARLGPKAISRTFVINLKQREVKLMEMHYCAETETGETNCRPTVVRLFAPYKRDFSEKLAHDVEQCDAVLNHILYLIKNRNENDKIRALIEQLIH